MGIDRIGKGAPVAPPPAKPETPSVGATGSTFEVRPEKTQVSAPPGQIESTPLERLHAGHIDVKGYVDLKVEEATALLKGLRPTEIQAIRETLRAHLTSDPALVDLVKHAAETTVPPPPEE